MPVFRYICVEKFGLDGLLNLLVCEDFFADRNLYTIRAVPFTEVRSIRRHTPTLGWQYIIVVLSSGNAMHMILFMHSHSFSTLWKRRLWLLMLNAFIWFFVFDQILVSSTYVISLFKVVRIFLNSYVLMEILRVMWQHILMLVFLLR